MQLHTVYSSLAIRNENKIVVLLIDGLGGMSHKDHGYKTELEYANHPKLDRLASQGTTGMLTPVLPGVTPGSGPAYLGLFGLDPVSFNIGRGVLEALGIGLVPELTDVLARGNSVQSMTKAQLLKAELDGYYWHLVPLLLVSSRCRRDGAAAFTETGWAKGALSNIKSKYLMGLLLAHALRLEKFGA
jgi:2,3-bisphosphoglycerate-independent phosphoglycerate mutase